MKHMVKGISSEAEKNISIMDNCLNQMGFTTRNILEMSKIKLNKFKPVYREVFLIDKIDKILNIVQDDIHAREI